MIPISKPDINEEEINAVTKVLRTGIIAQGKVVEKFENRFSNFVGVNHSIAVSSGTTALHLAILAAEIGKGDEVITTPFSFIASSNAILYTGATPVFVDIETNGFNINSKQIESKLTKKTKAILIVHLFGHPCDMDSILPIVKKHRLILIEDCCQAHGAIYRNNMVGSFGIGCFSFYATKNMTTGEGGMITTNNPEISEKVRLLRSHGSKIQYLSEILGYNFRMTEFQAAIGIEQLNKLPGYNAKRINNAHYFNEHLSKLEGITTPEEDSDFVKSVFHQYTIKIGKKFASSRELLQTELEMAGISSKIFYPIPIHLQPIYQKYNKTSLPITEKIVNEVLSIPIHPRLSNKDLAYIVSNIKRIAYSR